MHIQTTTLHNVYRLDHGVRGILVVVPLVHGKIGDRPFARTFYSIGHKRFSGFLHIEYQSKFYEIGWKDGFCVQGSSPMPADSILRVALTKKMVSATVAGSLQKTLVNKKPMEAAIELVSALRLTGIQKRELMEAHFFGILSRVFSLKNGVFTLSPGEVPFSEFRCDPRVAMLQGISSHYSTDRLLSELHRMSMMNVRCRGNIQTHLDAFGFSTQQKEFLETLKQGARYSDLMELVCENKELLVGLLVGLAGDCFESAKEVLSREQLIAAVDADSFVSKIVDTPSTNFSQSDLFDDEPTGTRKIAKIPIQKVSKTSLSSAIGKPCSPSIPAKPKQASKVEKRKPVRTKPKTIDTAAHTQKVKNLIEEKVGVLARSGSHYQMLGVSVSATKAEIQKAYFSLAKELHPDKLQKIDLGEMKKATQGLFSKINQAFRILSDEKLQKEYGEILAAGGEEAYKRQQREAEEKALGYFKAEESFHSGMGALTRGSILDAIHHFAQATELNPEEGEHWSFLAYTQFLHSENKREFAHTALGMISKGIKLSPRSANCFLCKGRILNQLGRSEEALSSFTMAQKLDPNNQEVGTEIRSLTNKKSSFFGKKR